MNRILCTLTVLLLAFLAAPGAALYCNGDITTIHAADETLYLDDRSQALGELDHWVYLEANGVEGLQSGDNGPIIQQHCVPGHCVNFTDLCQHVPDPDILIL